MGVGQVYNKKVFKEEIANQGFTGSLSTVENAASAFIDMAKKSPIGEDMCQGVLQGKDGLKRDAYDDLSLEAVAYSLYRYAKSREINMLRVSDLYNPEAEHGIYKEFRTTKVELLKKLRTLSSDANRVIIAELNMGLDHIQIVREDMSPEGILAQLAL